MKRYLLAILAFALVGCNLPDPQEAARLKTENETLQAQVSSLTSQRDAAVLERNDLRQRLEQIKAALENLPTSTSSSALVAPVVPPVPETPVVPETPPATTPETPAMPEAPAAPATPDSSSTPLIPSSALEKLQAYANEVLTAAQNFKAQTKQEAPTNCKDGYAAGAYNVQDSLDLKECSILAESNGDYRVTARDASGNSVSVP